MLASSKRLIYALSNKIWQKNQEGKLTIDFARVKRSPFDIKSESSYNANLSNGAFELGLKKLNCIAWADIPGQEYQDHVIEAKFQLDSLGGYAAAGIIFRIMDDDSYYMALVSSKGYFRLDVVKDSSPRTLIAWTEISGFDAAENNCPPKVKLKIITYGTYLIFLVNDKWLGEVNDNTVTNGKLGFAIASYSEENETEETNRGEHVCKAMFNYISVDTRIKSIEAEFKKWSDDSNINAEGRLRLAETFAVMGESAKALDQINRAWKRRDEVILTVSATAAVRTKRELLLAARMTFRLERYDEAEEYLDEILDQWANTPEGKLAYIEKMKVLNELNRFEKLRDFVQKNPSSIDKDTNYYTMLARCYWELKDYEQSAEMWDKAFETNNENENGIYASNAANAHELAGNKKIALQRYLAAGKIFLNQDNMPELAALIPKLSALGSKDWEARALAGKWAYSIEDYNNALKHFEASHKLRCAVKPVAKGTKPKADPAIYYLWGLIYYIRGNNKAAIRLLKRAVKLAPDFELFRTKLEEIMQIDGAA